MNKKTYIIDRKLYLIDIENYIGEAELTEEQVCKAKQELISLSSREGKDLYVIATSHTNNYVAAKNAWPSAMHVFKPGHNGADLALIEAAKEHMPMLQSFSEVSLFSGDGIFTTLVNEFKSHGAKVSVFSSACSLNRRLAYSASLLHFVHNPAVAA